MIITMNIGYEGEGSGGGILNRFPILYKVDSFKELSDLIRDNPFEWLLWAHMNYVPKSYQYFWLTIWEEYKGDQWQWEFKISVKNIRGYDKYISIPRDQMDEMRIQKERDDKINDILE